MHFLFLSYPRLTIILSHWSLHDTQYSCQCFWVFACPILPRERRWVMSNSLWPHGLYSLWNSPGQNTGVGSLSFLQGIFRIQRSNPGLPHCREILYHLSYQGSPRILEWVAYPFSRGPDLGIKPGSPSLQVDSLPAELPGKPQSSHCTSLSMQLFFIVEKLLLQFLDCSRQELLRCKL